MQAQIEPHFLFDTLASVRRLYQAIATRGSAMLQYLVRYLTASLPRMRESRSTLNANSRSRSHLNVQKIRMESRFASRSTVHRSRSRCRCPRRCSRPLANTVIHGVSPVPDGGTHSDQRAGGRGEASCRGGRRRRRPAGDWRAGVGAGNIAHDCRRVRRARQAEALAGLDHGVTATMDARRSLRTPRRGGVTTAVRALASPARSGATTVRVVGLVAGADGAPSSAYAAVVALWLGPYGGGDVQVQLPSRGTMCGGARFVARTTLTTFFLQSVLPSAWPSPSGHSHRVPRWFPFVRHRYDALHRRAWPLARCVQIVPVGRLQPGPDSPRPRVGGMSPFGCRSSTCSCSATCSRARPSSARTRCRSSSKARGSPAARSNRDCTRCRRGSSRSSCSTHCADRGAVRDGCRPCRAHARRPDRLPAGGAAEGRRSRSTVGTEVALARAWLDISRMLGRPAESRLAVPDDVLDARMPPMVLLPLLAGRASPAGSLRPAESVAVAVSAADGRLRVSVSDSGRPQVASTDDATRRSVRGSRRSTATGVSRGFQRRIPWHNGHRGGSS